MTTTETNPIDETRLEAFVGQAVTDMGAAISGLLLHIGDRLGLYKAMAGAGPVTSAAGGAAARGGFQQRAPGDSDPVQPHPGGQAMTVAPIAASSASPRARSAPPMATSVRAH
jgi:hypothetical protein